MTLKYNCPSCNSLLYTAFLKPGDTTLCHKCGETIIVPENAQPVTSLSDIARMAVQKRESMPEGYEPIVETRIDTSQPAVLEPQPRLPNYRYPGFWQAVGLIGLFLVILIALYIPVGIASAITNVKLHRIPAVENIITAAAYFFILLVGLKISKLPLKEVYPVKKAKPGLLISIVACSLGVIAIIVPIIYWIAMASGIESDSKERLMAVLNHPYAMFFSLLIIAPIFEELFFRGLLLRGFLARYSVKTAIVVNAIMFAVVHVNPLRIFATFFMGLINSWLRYKTNSITLSMFAHAFNNGLVYFVFIFLRNTEIPDDPGKIVFWEPFIFLLFGVALLFAGFTFIRRQLANMQISEAATQPIESESGDSNITKA